MEKEPKKEPKCQYHLGCHECHNSLRMLQAGVRQLKEHLHDVEHRLSSFSKMVSEVVLLDDNDKEDDHGV